jgi:hypothetical protein
MTHPFPYIKELENLPKIETLNDVLFVRDFVFSLIPWTPKPFIGNAIEKGVENLYYGFKDKTLSGWCGLNAEFFRLIICGYQVRCWSFNYGLTNYQITHASAVVNLCERSGYVNLIGLPFLIDPYFAKYYSYLNDFPLTYYQLMDLVHQRKTDLITSTYAIKIVKPVWDVEKQIFVDRSPQEFEKTVVNFFKNNLNYDEVMSKIFGDNDPILLMNIKIPD